MTATITIFPGQWHGDQGPPEPERDAAFEACLGVPVTKAGILAMLYEGLDAADGNPEEALDLVALELFGTSLGEALDRWKALVARHVGTENGTQS